MPSNLCSVKMEIKSEKIIKILGGIACSAALAISSVASTAAIASTGYEINSTQSSQSTQSDGAWVEVVRYIPVYVDGVLVGYIVYTTWVYTKEP